MKMQWLGWTLSAGCLALAGHAFAEAALPDAVLGGKLVYTGGDVQVKMMPADAALTSELGLYKAAQKEQRKQLIATSRETGKVVTITAAQVASYGIAKGDELIFGIFVPETSYTYFMGDGARNPDQITHSNATIEPGKGASVGFEDAFGGGDRDYNDNTFYFSGGIRVAPPPPPAPANTPPDCSKAKPSVTELWPPNHKLVPVSIEGITDTEPFKVQIVSVFQDEPVGSGNKSDAEIVDGSSVRLRAERLGKGNSRVYNITFNAIDSKGAKCPDTTLSVAVPHNRHAETPPVGPVTYDSTKPSEQAKAKGKPNK